MDNLLILVTLALLVATLFWMAQARHWRAKAKASEHAAMRLACDLSRASNSSWEAGLIAGLRQGTGAMYLAAMRVDASEPILVALRARGRQLLKDFEEPVVQVPVEA